MKQNQIPVRKRGSSHRKLSPLLSSSIDGWDFCYLFVDATESEKRRETD
jgi:hypothetical protein